MDVVVFGASGFTGQFVVRHLARAVRDKDLRWAVAGRSEAKLRKVLDEAATDTGLELGLIPVVVCDVEDGESLSAMAKQTRLVINCVGPYRFYGEQGTRLTLTAWYNNTFVVPFLSYCTILYSEGP